MASASSGRCSDEAHVDCPSCGEELTGDALELPCGHCICRRCAKELESKNTQTCALQNCPYNRIAYEDRIEWFNLPRIPVSEIDNSFMLPPPPSYQGKNVERTYFINEIEIIENVVNFRRKAILSG